MFTAVVAPDPETPGRWVLCRYSPAVGATAEASYPSRAVADSKRPALQRQFDAVAAQPVPTTDVWEPRQIVFGFYSDEDAR